MAIGSRNVLAVLLVLSILLMIIILALDSLLWFDNPKNYHAYALIGFTVIQVVLLGAFFASPKMGLTALLRWSIFLLIAFLANPLTASQIGFSPQEFAQYLYGFHPQAQPPFRFSFLILVILQFLIVISCFTARMKSKGEVQPQPKA